MTLGASTITDAVGGWAQGCLVLLIGVWLFLALLGIRNARFPYRLSGGAAFVVGSALWIGLHPALAEAWHLDAGRIGWWAQSGLAGKFADGSFMLSGVGALLLLCSLVGFLIAIDWLPLWPFAPMVGRLDALFGTPRDARAGGAGRAAPTPTTPTTMLRSSAAATLEREAPARPTVAPPTASTAPTVRLPPPASVIPAMVPPAARTTPDPAPEVELATPPQLDDEPSQTDWARFRPRAASADAEVASADLTMDNAAAASHNSSTPGGESRASIDVAEPAGSPESEGKDPPVLARDHTETDATNADATSPNVPSDIDGSPDSAATAVVSEEEAPDAALEFPLAPPLPEAPVDEELSPRRKKEEEPSEEPGEEPAEDPDDEGEDDAEDDEAGDDDLTEDEDAEDEDDLDEEEDWEDDEEEEDEEEEDEDEDEDEEDKKEDDEDWDDEDEDEDDEDAKEDDEDDDKDDDKDEDWDGDEKGSSLPPAPEASAASAIVEIVTPVAEVAASPVADAPVADAPATADAEVAEITASTDAASTDTGADVESDLPTHLFSDLPQDERVTLVRAVELILGAESISLSRLQRELGITYYSAARVFERLEKDGFIAPYSGSLARSVQMTRELWEARRRTS